MKILHVITGLSVGGAEMTLYRLLAHRESADKLSHVVSLTPPGPLGGCIRDLGIPVSTANMRCGVPGLMGFVRLVGVLRRFQPDLIQTWMYHADFCGAIAARLTGRTPVIWDIQNGSLDKSKSKLGTRMAAKACASLSKSGPARIVCCSQSSREIHHAMGYQRDRMLVIPNGCDTTVFKADASCRLSVRRELGINGEILIGLSARFDPQKDHQNFVEAAGRVLEREHNVRFVLFGSGVTWDNPRLAKWVHHTGHPDRFFLLGLRDDIPRLTAALDIAALASAYGEGLPLVVGEAMSCEVPCVVTDVGDCKLLVSDTGKAVPARNSPALAVGLEELIKMGAAARKALGQAARKRIQTSFSLNEMVRQYYELYREIAGARVAPRNQESVYAVPALPGTRRP